MAKKTQNKNNSAFGFSMIISLAGIIFVFLQWKNNLGLIPLWLNISLVLSSLLLVPGYLLSGMLFSSERFDVFERVPVYFILGMAFISLFTFVSYIFEMSLVLLIYIYLASCLCLWVAGVYSRMNRNNNAPLVSSREDNNKVNNKQAKTIWLKYLGIYMFVLLLVSVYLSVYFGGWPSGDFIIHLPKIRQIIELNRITYGDFFVKGLNKSVRAHNVLHPLLAAVSVISHVDPIKVWALCIAFFTPIGLMTFFSATKNIFRNEYFAYFSASVFFLWKAIFNMHFGTRQSFWSMGSSYPCPAAFNTIFYSIILWFLFKYIYENNKTYVYVFPFIGITLAFIHMTQYLYILFAIGSFLVLSLFVKAGIKDLSRKILVSLLLLFMLGGFYTLYMQKQLNKPIVNPVYQTISGEVNPGWNPVKFIKDKYPYIDPFIGLWPGFLEKVAFLSVPFLVLFFKKNLWSVYFFSVPVAVMFLLLNPVLLYFLRPLHPSMAGFYIIVDVIPYMWLFSLFIFYSLKLIGEKYGKNIVLAIAVILVLPVVKYGVDGINYLEKIQSTSAGTLKMVDDNAEFMKKINSLIPAGSVVLMDENKVWFWPVYFPHFVITHPNRGLFAPNFDPTPRREGLKKFLESPLGEQSFAFLNDFNVDYLLIDSRYIVNKDFNKYRNKFQEIFSVPAFNIYRYLK